MGFFDEEASQGYKVAFEAYRGIQMLGGRLATE